MIGLQKALSRIFLAMISLSLAFPVHSRNLTRTPAPEATNYSKRVEEIIKDSLEIPQNKKELRKILNNEFNSAVQKHLSTLLLSTPSTVHKNIAQALSSPQNIENLDRLVELMDNNKANFIKFLAAVTQELEKNPKNLDRMTRSAENLEKYYVTSRNPMPPIGHRFFMTFMYIVGFSSLAYGSYDFIMTNSPIGEAVFKVVPYMLLALLVNQAIAEAVAMKVSLKTYFENLKRRIRAKNNTREIAKALRSIKENPRLLNELSRIKYYGSTHAEKAAIDLLPEINKKFLEITTETIKNHKLWGVAKKFFMSDHYFRFFKKLNRNLTQLEKEQLIRKAANLGTGIPLTLSQKALDLERALTSRFHEWMNTEEVKNKNEQLRHLLNQRSFMNTLNQQSSTPRATTLYNMEMLSIAIGLLGLTLAVNVSPNEALINYQAFAPKLAEMLATYRTQLLYGAGVLVSLPTLASFYQGITHLRRAANSHFYSPFKLQNFNSVIKLVTRRDRINSFSASSCRALFN